MTGAPEDRIALTVIGGYLGAGKTTLVNHLLRDADERVAVLVNDFGEINVDLDLIERRTDDTIELSNGCICCSMIDGFSEALDRILDLDPRPARLVIETSGVADPAQVAAYGHGPGLALDAVIVLVDAETIRANADDRLVGQTVRTQLAAAEIVIINKADLVETTDLADTSSWIGEVCPHAVVMTAIDSRVANEVLFGQPSAHRPSAATSQHLEHVFVSHVVTIAEAQTRESIESLMAELSPRTVRAKGLVHLEGEREPFVLQRVGPRITLRRSTRSWPGTPQTEIVVIETADGP